MSPSLFYMYFLSYAFIFELQCKSNANFNTDKSLLKKNKFINIYYILNKITQTTNSKYKNLITI